MVDLSLLANSLAEEGQKGREGFNFEVNPIPGEVEVLQILVEDREELPIFVSASAEQITCIAYLFKKDEVQAESIDAMNQAMLSTNISIPLSAFAQVDDQYVIYGALSVQSTIEDIAHEIAVLSSNTLEAIEAMSDYLKT